MMLFCIMLCYSDCCIKHNKYFAIHKRTIHETSYSGNSPKERFVAISGTLTMTSRPEGKVVWKREGERERILSLHRNSQVTTLVIQTYAVVYAVNKVVYFLLTCLGGLGFAGYSFIACI